MKLRDVFINVAFRIDKGGTADIGKVNRKVENFSRTIQSINMAGFIAKVTAVRYALNSLRWVLDKTIGLFTSFLKAGSDKERIDITFEILTKNAEMGKKTLEELHALAVTRPFTVPEVERGAAVLLAMGFEAENLRDMMADISDITAALPNLTLDRFAYNLGQVRAATYLRGMELRDFISQGVPLMDELLKLDKFRGMGTAQLRETIEKRGVSFDDVAQAIRNMTSEGGLFFGMSERVMTTLFGLYSNFVDALVLIRREIGVKLTPIVKPLFLSVIMFFSKNKDSIVNFIVEPMSAVLKLLVVTAEAMGFVIGLFYDIIEYMIGFRRLINIIKSVILFLITRAVLGVVVTYLIKIGVLLVKIKKFVIFVKKLGWLQGLLFFLGKIITAVIVLKNLIVKIFAPLLLKVAFFALLALMVEDFYLWSKYGDKIDSGTGRLLKQFPWLINGLKVIKSIVKIIAGLLLLITHDDNSMVTDGIKEIIKSLDDALKSLTGIDNVLHNIITKTKWLRTAFTNVGKFIGGNYLEQGLNLGELTERATAPTPWQKKQEEKDRERERAERRSDFQQKFKPERSGIDINVTGNVNIKGEGMSEKSIDTIKKNTVKAIHEIIGNEINVELAPGGTQ